MRQDNYSRELIIESAQFMAHDRQSVFCWRYRVVRRINVEILLSENSKIWPLKDWRCEMVGNSHQTGRTAQLTADLLEKGSVRLEVSNLIKEFLRLLHSFVRRIDKFFQITLWLCGQSYLLSYAISSLMVDIRWARKSPIERENTFPSSLGDARRLASPLAHHESERVTAPALHCVLLWYSLSSRLCSLHLVSHDSTRLE